jgi:hypothetical protein
MMESKSQGFQIRKSPLAQKLKALSGVGLFFLFNKTFNSCFDVNFFWWKVLVVWV